MRPNRTYVRQNGHMCSIRHYEGSYGSCQEKIGVAWGLIDRPHGPVYLPDGNAMKLNKKNLGTLIALLLLGALVGSLAWEVLERVIRATGSDFSLTMDRALQLFDLYVLAVSVRANPGTIAGLAAGAVLFVKV